MLLFLWGIMSEGVFPIIFVHDQQFSTFTSTFLTVTDTTNGGSHEQSL